MLKLYLAYKMAVADVAIGGSSVLMLSEYPLLTTSQPRWPIPVFFISADYSREFDTCYCARVDRFVYYTK